MERLLTAAKAYFAKPFAGVIRIEIEEDGMIWVDGRQAVPIVGTSAPEHLDGAYCLWQAAEETLNHIFSPEARRLETAFIAGRLTISGDMAVMARLSVGRNESAT